MRRIKMLCELKAYGLALRPGTIQRFADEGMSHELVARGAAAWVDPPKRRARKLTPAVVTVKGSEPEE